MRADEVGPTGPPLIRARIRIYKYDLGVHLVIVRNDRREVGVGGILVFLGCPHMWRVEHVEHKVPLSAPKFRN